jgi:hypothetical protein
MGTTAVKIAERKEKIVKLKARIVADQERVSKLEAEIDELESLEVKGIMKEYCLTVEEFRTLVASQQAKLSEHGHIPAEA